MHEMFFSCSAQNASHLLLFIDIIMGNRSDSTAKFILHPLLIEFPMAKLFFNVPVARCNDSLLPVASANLDFGFLEDQESRQWQ